MSRGFNGLNGLVLAILITASGTVELQRNGFWGPIAPGAQINDGERVRTGVGSSATIDLGSGAIISLSQASEIQVQQTKDPNVRSYTAGAQRPHQDVLPSTYYLSPYVCVNPPKK